MPRIVIDARKYADFGIGTYIRGLLSGFAAGPPDWTFHLLTRPTEVLPAYPPGWTNQAVKYRGYGIGEFVAMGGVLRRSNARLFHSPHYTVPLAPGLVTVVTIHDVIHLRFPEIFSPLQRAYARMMIRHALRSAAAILTPSDSTKQDLLERFDVREERIHVTPLGVDAQFRPLDAASVEAFRVQHDLPRRFVLFLGNPKPHKGISVLLQSIRAIIRQNKDLPLVIAGGAEHVRPRLDAEITALGIVGRVHFISKLSVDDVPLLINGATVLVMPSLWEGFGLPVLEAMACGTPVVCTKAGSLPEVAGEAALMVPPGDPEALADGLLRLTGNESLRTDLRAKGLLRAAEYRWDRTAELTRDVYSSLVA